MLAASCICGCSRFLLNAPGLERLTIDARVVIASVDTYLRFADAVNRLNISEQDPKADLPELMGKITGKPTKPVADDTPKSPLQAAGEKLINTLTQPQPKRQTAPQRRSRQSTS